MRVALAREFNGIDGVELADLPDPTLEAGKVLVRVHAAGVGPWDVGMLGGGFPALSTPFVAGQEIAGVVEASGDGAGVQPGDGVFGTVFPFGGGFGELVSVDSNRLAPMPAGSSFEEAAALVIGAGTAHEGLIDRGRLQSGQSVLITAASGGVGSAAVQIAVAAGADVVGVASRRNHDYLRSLGAREVFDYHDDDWADQVRAAVPGGVDLLLDASGGQTRDRGLGAVRDGGRGVTIVLNNPPAEPERGITWEAFAAQVDRRRLQELSRLVEVGKLRLNIDAVLPLEQVREALARVADGHTRGKVVLKIR